MASAYPTLSHTGRRIDLVIRQGIDFSQAFAIKAAGVPMNLAGYQFRGQMRKDPLSVGLPVLSFGFVVVAALGQVEMTAGAAALAAVACGPTLEHRDSKYFWDCEMVDALGKVHPLFHGDLAILREVTRG